MKREFKRGFSFILVMAMLLSMFIMPTGVMAGTTNMENDRAIAEVNDSITTAGSVAQEKNSTESDVGEMKTEFNKVPFATTFDTGSVVQRSESDTAASRQLQQSPDYNIPTYSGIYKISTNVISNGSITIKKQDGSNHDVAYMKPNDKVIIYPVANLGCEFVPEKLHYKIDGQGAEIPITKDNLGVYSFFMPASNIVIYAEFKQKANGPLRTKNLNVNAEFWELGLTDEAGRKIPNVEGKEPYIELTLEKDGQVIMPMQKCPINKHSYDFGFYRTTDIKKGTYVATLVGKYQESGVEKTVDLGTANLTFDNSLQIKDIRITDGKDWTFNRNQKNITVEISTRLFSDLEGLNVKFVKRESVGAGEELLPDAKYYREGVNSVSNVTCMNFEFRDEKLQVGSYDLQVEYPTGVDIDVHESLVLKVTDLAVFKNGKLDLPNKKVTFDVYGIPDGSYNDVYCENQELTNSALTMIVAGNKGSIDVTGLGLNDNLPLDLFFSISHDKVKYSLVAYTNPWEEQQNDIWIENGGNYYQNTVNDYVDSIIAEPEDKVLFSLEYTNNPIKYKQIALVEIVNSTGSVNVEGKVLKSIPVSGLQKDGEYLIGDFNRPNDGWGKDKVYAVVLTDSIEGTTISLDMFPYTAFTTTPKPFVSISGDEWCNKYSTIGYYNDTASVMNGGILNIADLSKLKFFDGNGGEITAKIGKQYKSITFEMNGKPDIVKLTATYDGKAVLLPQAELKLLRLDSSAPRITTTHLVSEGGVIYVEGINLNSAVTSTVKLFAGDENGKRKQIAEANLIKSSDNRLEVPASLFTGVGNGKYILFYLIDGYTQAYQFLNRGETAPPVGDTFTVTFIDHDGSVLKVQEGIAKGNGATAPTLDKIHKGYEFKNWDKAFDNITANLTVSAVCVPISYTVKFHAMGGTTVNAYEHISHGAIITAPTVPTLEGYTFSGWYSDYGLKTPWNFENDKVEKNLTLYAKWTLPVANITCQTAVNGSISCTPSAFAGDFVRVTVTPESGHILKSLVYTCNKISIAVPIGSEPQHTYEFVMPRGGDVSLVATFEKSNSLTVTVSNVKSTSYYINVSGDNGYYMNKNIESTTGPVTFASLKNGNYWVSISCQEADNWYNENKVITINGNSFSVNFDIPITYNVSGKVNSINGKIENIGLRLIATDGTYYWANSDSAGNYKFSGVTPNTYKVSVNNYDNRYSVVPEKDITVGTEDVTVEAFDLIAGADLLVNLSKTDGGAVADKANLQLHYYEEGSKQWNYITYESGGGSGTIEFDGAISRAGKYKILIVSLQNKNWTEYPHVSQSKEFEVTAADIKSGTIGQNLTYVSPTNMAEAFTGDGNFVTTDLKTVLVNGKVNLEIKYRNNGNVDVNPKFTLTPSDKITINDKQDIHDAGTLKPGESGKHKAVINIGDVTGDFGNIQVTVTINGTTYDFGNTVLEIMNVNLTAPASVKTGEDFIVYGEATEGSSVNIKDAHSGRVYATVQPSGKFYSAKIKFENDGEYQLVAEVVKNKETKLSGNVAVQSSTLPITVSKVTKDGYQDLPKNMRIGVYVFNQYVDMQLMGRNFSLNTEFTNSGEISKVVYEFSNMKFEAQKSGNGYEANFSGWGGAGLKPIVAKITKTNGKVIEIVVAEVTILIDPSGVIKNALNDKPVQGATVKCYILDGSVWKLWEAEKYVQVNPQKTDADGKYGWMVPDGKYRITAACDGFEDYDSLTDKKFTNAQGESTIDVPPARDDVNFALNPKTYNIQGVQAAGGSFTVSDTAKYTAEVTVNVIPAEGKELSALIVKTVTGKDVKTNGNKFIMPNEDVTVTAQFGEKGSGGGNGGNGGGSSVIKPPTEQIKAGTVTNSDGSVVTTTVDEKTGTVVQTKKELNGIITETTAQKDGSISATVTIPEGLGKVKIEIPVKGVTGNDPKSGMVAVIIGADGSQKIVAKSAIEGDSLLLSLDGSVKLKFIDNSKDFGDMQKHWAKDAITFVTARELFNGTSDKIFNPDMSMSRAMLVTVMYRLQGTTENLPESNFGDVDHEAWYADSVNWAVANNIAKGEGKDFNPNGDVTREQLAVIIYNYAKIVGMNVDKTAATDGYTDSDDVSVWAKKAMSWAVGAGIITGKTSDTIDPKGHATRAEVATMLERTVELMVK